MRKFLTVLLSVAMLLGACACAEGVRASLKDIEIYEDGALTEDLSGFDVSVVAATTGEEDAGVRLYCTANGEVLMNFTVGVAGDQLLFGYGEGEGYSDSFVLPGQGGELGLRDMILAHDPAQRGDWSLAAALKKRLPAESMTDGGIVSYNGEDCATTRFEMDETYMDGVLKAFLRIADRHPQAQQMLSQFQLNSFQQLLELLQVRVRVTGGLYEGADADYVDLTAVVTLMNQPVEFHVTVAHTSAPDGQHFDMTLSADDANKTYSMHANAEIVSDGDAPWLPLDTSGAEVLEMEELDMNELVARITAKAQSIFRNVSDGVMDVIHHNHSTAGN